MISEENPFLRDRSLEIELGHFKYPSGNTELIQNFRKENKKRSLDNFNREILKPLKKSGIKEILIRRFNHHFEYNN